MDEALTGHEDVASVSTEPAAGASGTEAAPAAAPESTERVRLDAELELNLGSAEAGGRVYRAVLIRPGEWQGKGIRCPAEVLQAAAARFNGLASFLNPPPAQPGQHGHPMLERLLGVTENARWDEALNAVVADYRLADTDVANGFRRLVDGWLRAKAAGRAVPAIGLSAVPWVRLGPPDAAGVRDVREIVSVDQVDAVYRPAAGGEFLQIKAAVEGDVMGESESPAHEGVTHEAHEETVGPAGGGTVDPAEGGVAGTPAAPARPAALSEMVGGLRDTLLQSRLALSGLPERWRRVVSEGLPATWDLDTLDRTIQRVKAAHAEETAASTVQGIRPVVSGMQNGLDQVEEALAALIEGRSPRAGVRPLSGVREAYLLLSGDYEMTGRFHADRVQLANVSSTTMTNIVANVLNKVVVNEFQTYPRWWAPIARTESFSSLQEIKWITLGGVGELPAISEGAAYTELNWKDAAEAANWQKRGGYLGITLEAMDKDDVGRLRNAPRALAQAAWLTLGKAIAGIFTSASGAGPTLADGTSLFHADHGNLGSTALGSGSWSAAKLAMRKQGELGSNERLGGLTAPKYLLVPPDLEGTALTVLGSEGLPGTANNDVNPEAEGNSHDARLAAARRRIIVVDLWTDVNDWAAVADPRMYPTIGLGFRYGETPEIFSVASPNSGLMFSNDVMPIKVRWFFAAGAMDYRGLYKANVG